MPKNIELWGALAFLLVLLAAVLIGDPTDIDSYLRGH